MTDAQVQIDAAKDRLNAALRELGVGPEPAEVVNELWEYIDDYARIYCKNRINFKAAVMAVERVQHDAEMVEAILDAAFENA